MNTNNFVTAKCYLRNLQLARYHLLSSFPCIYWLCRKSRSKFAATCIMWRTLRFPTSMTFTLLTYKVALYQLYRGTAVQRRELITKHAMRCIWQATGILPCVDECHSRCIKRELGAGCYGRFCWFFCVRNRDYLTFLNSSSDGTDTRYGWVCKIIVMISLSRSLSPRCWACTETLSRTTPSSVFFWDINCSPALSTSWTYINELCSVRDSRPVEREIQRARTNREHFLDKRYGALA